ncbi:MAG TPA: hypothetical protein PKC87_01330 [Candidatus Absconditabacterales bacterium]|nr:hypothetical protein [Candidatus Absconditabacterales bacterium]
MKKLKLHKTFIGAMLIWFANIMCGPFKTYFAAIMMFLIFIAFSSCSSTNHYNYSRAKKKADKMVKSAQQQYAIVNNQIIIFQ